MTLRTRSLSSADVVTTSAVVSTRVLCIEGCGVGKVAGSNTEYRHQYRQNTGSNTSNRLPYLEVTTSRLVLWWW